MPLNPASVLAKRGLETPFNALPFTAGEDVASLSCNFLDAAR